MAEDARATREPGVVRFLSSPGPLMWFGIVYPVLSLLLNYALSDLMDILYMVGARFYLPRLAFLYLVIGTATAGAMLWARLLRTGDHALSAVVAGALLSGSLWALAIAFLGAWRLSIFFPVWMMPAVVSGVWFYHGKRAWSAGRRVLRGPLAAVPAVAGAAAVSVVPLVVVPQPWRLIWELPDANSADLSGMDLRDVYLEGCADVSFEQADLSDVDLRGAFLGHCKLNLRSSRLRRADLRGATLDVVELSYADLRGADLTGASVYMVDFVGTDLRGASLGFHARGRIDMGKALLSGADLSQMHNLEGGVYDWEGATYDARTVWPPGVDPREIHDFLGRPAELIEVGVVGGDAVEQ